MRIRLLNINKDVKLQYQNEAMNILVTGVAGFIGSHTAERLFDAGHNVIGVDNFNNYYSLELKQLNTKSLEDKGVRIIKKDLRDADLVSVLPKDIHYIFHFAAQPGISGSSSFEDYFTNNVIATKIASNSPGAPLKIATKHKSISNAAPRRQGTASAIPNND